MNHIDIAKPENIQFYRNKGIEYPCTSGIYMAKNILNNKVYIGSTRNLRRRINNHMWNINNHKHRNIHFQNSVNKYGWDNFYFIILEECEEKNNIAEREQFWIEYYKSYKKDNGYNKQPVAYSNKGNKLSDETKLKISKAFKGKPKTPEHNLKNSLTKRGPLHPIVTGKQIGRAHV